MQRDPQVRAHVAALHPTDRAVICTITRGEILYGLERLPMGRRRRNLEAEAAHWWPHFPCWSVPAAAAAHYAHLKRGAESQGTPLGENDLWLGATAMVFGAVLVTGDSAYLSQWTADLCAAMRMAGIFRGKGSYVFEIEGQRQRASHWKKIFAARLAQGWGCAEEVYRVEAVSPTFGEVILVFYRPQKGSSRIEYLVVVGKPLRACEALRAYHRHHWIEEFWQILRSVLHVEATSLWGKAGALAGVGIKVVAFLLLTEIQHGLKKLRRFSQLTLHQLVHLCPKFVDMRAFMQEHFHDRIPANYSLDQALDRL